MIRLQATVEQIVWYVTFLRKFVKFCNALKKSRKTYQCYDHYGIVWNVSLKRIEAENITWFYCHFYAYFNI